MSKPVARVGDNTSHGGVIVEGDSIVQVNGKSMARVGDAVTCPKCKGSHVKEGIPRPQTHSEDGKLTSSEIIELEQLNWTSDSMMQVYGCRSGLLAPKTSKSTIQCFFETQSSLSTIYWQSGWTYFTDSPDKHSYITPTIGGRLWPGYSVPVYLWAYWRKRNQKTFEKDPSYINYKCNDKMDPVVLSR